MERSLHHPENPNRKIDKAMNPEQFNQVVAAILEGKYSWACVLILRFAGYNPCHYIPRRTYNRLVRENVQGIRRSDRPTEPVFSAGLNHVSDLSYLEVLQEKKAEIRGGCFDQWLIAQLRNSSFTTYSTHRTYLTER
ncbi:MAG: HetP family heterocyst commitment protein [Leptolyngbyaceae cyanobacterium SU_3_3]|nr:HetP family heterocyst commitment protein [Leptolyngbyaceae cyanobacterium SU_3_3]NJR52207.1 HetP family heterocyst commitment protein [Leptolyngbyaceae cyanobacterium CSU_1_3]